MNILVLSPIADSTIESLRGEHNVQLTFGDSALQPQMWPESETDIVILRSGVGLRYDRMIGMPRLRAVIRAGSGIDNVDQNFLELKGIPLISITGLNIDAVAELTFGLFLDLARRITLSDRLLRQGYWSKHEQLGTELRGKTLGIVGLGNIGNRVADLGVAWGMEVVGVVQRFTQERVISFAQRGIELLVSLLDVAERSDFVSIHLPLIQNTEGIINNEFLFYMKETAYLVNVSRGAVVNNQALYNALRENRIAGAGLDVHQTEEGESPFARLHNVVLTPHIGSCTAETQQAIGKAVLRAVADLS